MAARFQQLELRDVVSSLSSVSWDDLKRVLLDLGVPKNKLDDIEATYPTSVSSRRMSALDCWLQMDVGASWERLVGALNSCDLVMEAHKIGVKHLGWVDGGEGSTEPVRVFTTSGTDPIVVSTRGHTLTDPSSTHRAASSVPSLTDKPTLAQLRKLKLPGGQEIRIIDQVAGKWDEIAIAMDFDPEGHTQTAINRDFSTVQEKCRETFKKWLQGIGDQQPATWEKLVEILRDCNFIQLATSIEAALK